MSAFRSSRFNDFTEQQPGSKQLMLRNKVPYRLIYSFPASELRNKRRARDHSVSKYPIEHCEACKKHPKFGREPVHYSVRSFAPLNLLGDKKNAYLRLKFGQPFVLPIDFGPVRDHRKLFASAKDKGKMVLFEYLEERPPLLNEVGMGAKIVNYHVKNKSKLGNVGTKGSDGSISKSAEEKNKVEQDTLGHNVNITAADEEEVFPLLGRKSLKAGSTTSVLWTNLSRARVKKQRTSHCDFLVSIVGKKKLGKKQRLSKKAKIWPMPPTYAVGQQEVIADTSMHGKEKADFRKEYYKLKILKIMKDRQSQFANTAGNDRISEAELEKLLPLTKRYAPFTNTYIAARRMVLSGNPREKVLKPAYRDLDDKIQECEKKIRMEDVVLHNSFVNEIELTKSVSFLSSEFIPELASSEDNSDAKKNAPSGTAAALPQTGSSKESSRTTTTKASQMGEKNKNLRPRTAFNLQSKKNEKGKRWVQEILDPEKGPLRILLNVQNRRLNRLRRLEAQRKLRVSGRISYFSLFIYDKRIAIVKKAVDRGRKEINCIKSFITTLQTLPWKLKKNFHNNHVWIKKRSAALPQRLRLMGPEIRLESMVLDSATWLAMKIVEKGLPAIKQIKNCWNLRNINLHKY